MKSRIKSFPPVVSENSKILILGSIPGVKSLEKQEYYAHPQNQFWKLMFCIFNEEFSMNYEDRTNLLKNNKIAIWDTIESCERVGSLDTNIKNEVSNQIPDLLENYPNIKVIFCNGQKSYKNLLKLLGKEFKIPIVLMPSTSPLHTISFESKLKEWKRILEFV